MLRALLGEISEGKELIPVVKYMTQQKIERFAVATCNSGSAHLDPVYCAERFPQKKPYAFGFMLLAYISEVMEINFGEQWARTGVLDIKFIGAVYSGQSYVVSGVVESVRRLERCDKVTCQLKAIIHNGECAAVAMAQVDMPV